MEIIKNKITIGFTKAEKGIIENFMNLSEQFSKICGEENLDINCDDCPFKVFCTTYFNTATDVENFINRQINE